MGGYLSNRPGGGASGNVESVTGNIVNNTDPNNPVVTQEQADWTETDSGEVSFIQNKPPVNVGDGTDSMIIGVDADADGDNAFAIGVGAVASGNLSVNIGNGANDPLYGGGATGIGAVAIGSNNVGLTAAAPLASGDYSFAAGLATQAVGDYSTAIGALCVAFGDASIALGQATANGDGSIAMASGNASGAGSIAMGANATALGANSISMGGNSSQSTGDFSLAIAYAGEAASYAEIVFGFRPLPYTPSSTTVWVATDRQFVIGGGAADEFTPNNIITALKNGKIGLNGIDLPTAWLHLPPATTNFASLRIPTGTAPTSPNDGDMWQVTNHLYVRLNGVTYQLDQQSGSGTVADGNYGDITVSGAGTVWGINTNVVGDAELRQSAGLSVIGRSADTTGDVADITAGTDNQVLRRSGTTLAFGAVNLASSAAVTGSLAAANGGTGQDSSAWAQGDIIYISATGVWNHLAKDTNATRYLSNTGTSNNPEWAQINLTNGVTGDLPFSNLTQGAALSVLGVTGNATADVASIAGTANQILRVNGAGNALAFGSIDLSQSAAVGTSRLAYANITQGSARSVLGVTGNATADVASIQGTADQVLRVNGAGTALAFGQIATAGITDAAVTYAKIQNVTTQRLLGRNTAGSGVVEEITAVQGRGILGLAVVSTDTAIVKYSGTTGATQNTAVLIDSSNNVSTAGYFASNTIRYGTAGVTTTGTNENLLFEVNGTGFYRFNNSGSTIPFVGIGVGPSYVLDIGGGSSTNAVRMPAGTTAQRPTSAEGLLRFNTDDDGFEGYDGTNWFSLGMDGSYTPTFTNVANTTGTNAYTTYWYRIKNKVTVFGKVDITTSTNATLTQLSVTLPIAPATFGGTEEAGGSCNSVSSAGDVFGVRANNGGTDVYIEGICGTAGLNTYSFSFSYDLL